MQTYTAKDRGDDYRQNPQIIICLYGNLMKLVDEKVLLKDDQTSYLLIIGHLAMNRRFKSSWKTIQIINIVDVNKITIGIWIHRSLWNISSKLKYITAYFWYKIE